MILKNPESILLSPSPLPFFVSPFKLKFGNYHQTRQEETQTILKNGIKWDRNPGRIMLQSVGAAPGNIPRLVYEFLSTAWSRKNPWENLCQKPQGIPEESHPPPSRIDGNVKAYQRNRWTDIQYSKFRITSIKAGGICSVSSGYGNGVKEPPNGSWNTPQDSKNPKVSVKNRLWR